jgi:hypothetical protein
MRWLDPILGHVADHNSLSARARHAGQQAADALELRIPTLDQTLR